MSRSRYDHHVVVVCSAAAAPRDLFSATTEALHSPTAEYYRSTTSATRTTAATATAPATPSTTLAASNNAATASFAPTAVPCTSSTTATAASGVGAHVVARGGSSGRPHTPLGSDIGSGGDGGVEWSATGLAGVSLVCGNLENFLHTHPYFIITPNILYRVAHPPSGRERKRKIS